MPISTLFFHEAHQGRERKRRAILNGTATTWRSLFNPNTMPELRYMGKPQYSMWSDTLRYTQHLANGEIFTFLFTADMDTMEARLQDNGPYGRTEVQMFIKVPYDPREWLTNARVMMYKRALRVRMAARVHRHNIPAHIQDRHRKQRISPDYDPMHNLRRRHADLLTKVKSLYNARVEMEGPDCDRARGWLRFMRHVQRDPGLIAYSVDDAFAIDGRVSWPRYAHHPLKSRVRGKMSKLFGACGIAPHIAGLLFQDWQAAHANNIQYEILEGEEIVEAYRSALGIGSCMTGDEGSEYVTMYATTPDKIKMLVLTVDDQRIGRAILWKLDEEIDGKMYHLDRTYPQSDKVEALFRRYVEQRGDCYSYLAHDLPTAAKCTVKAPDNLAIPYFDTFSGVNVTTEDGVKMFTATRGHADYDGESTEGGAMYNGNDSCYCAGCGDRVSLDDVYTDDWDEYCQECYEDRFTDCDRCGRTVRLDACSTHETAEGNYVCDNCRAIAYSTCPICDELILNTNMRSNKTYNGSPMCACCATDYVNCHECGETLRRDLVNEQDGQLVCDSCYMPESEGN